SGAASVATSSARLWTVGGASTPRADARGTRRTRTTPRGGPAGGASRRVFYSDTRRRPLCSDARHAAARHLHEVRGGQPEHGLGVARRGPDLVPLEEVLVDHGRERPGGADGCDAADRESRAGADEGGVRLLDRLVDELRDA